MISPLLLLTIVYCEKLRVKGMILPLVNEAFAFGASQAVLEPAVLGRFPQGI